MLSEDIVMGDRVTEEPMSLIGDFAGAIAVFQTHELDGEHYIRIYRRTNRKAFFFQRLVVSADPRPDLIERDEGEGERSDSVASGKLDRVGLGARDPQWRMRLLHRLGHHIAWRHFEVLSLMAPERLFGEHPADRFE